MKYENYYEKHEKDKPGSSSRKSVLSGRKWLKRKRNSKKIKLKVFCENEKAITEQVNNQSFTGKDILKNCSTRQDLNDRKVCQIF
jgi:hypothetical protein